MDHALKAHFFRRNLDICRRLDESKYTEAQFNALMTKKDILMDEIRAYAEGIKDKNIRGLFYVAVGLDNGAASVCRFYGIPEGPPSNADYNFWS